MTDSLAIVTFSHLRWNFVYQRPQHLMSRLAQRSRVIFIEEPIFQAGSTPHWAIEEPQPGLLVCQLLTPNDAPGFHSSHLPVMVPMVQRLLADQGIDHRLAWLYTPLALPIAQAIAPAVLIYDCMDELSAFLHAPPELLAAEEALLQQADVVFTGGPSLYQSKRYRNPRVYCFPSSVDAAHFAAATHATTNEPADQRGLAHPRLGFYGVVDERFDTSLLAAVAEAHPEWQMVIVGPVVKIAPAQLPHQANILYTGQRSYNELPAYLSGWDVCLLPFARNAATRFISPTKTLEYMAAERPIVSTPITDVADLYREIVYLGDTPSSFIAACERALNAPDSERAARFAAMRVVLAETSWDKTAKAMADLITQIAPSSHM